MKKRMVVLLLVMIMISGLCVNAMATERASQIKPKLSFSGKTANCSVTVVEAGKLDVTLELWNGSEMVDSWSDSGTNYLNVSGSHAAVSGTTPRASPLRPRTGRRTNRALPGRDET